MTSSRIKRAANQLLDQAKQSLRIFSELERRSRALRETRITDGLSMLGLARQADLEALIERVNSLESAGRPSQPASKKSGKRSRNSRTDFSVPAS